MAYRIDSTLRDRLEQLRLWAGLTGPELAEKANIDKKTELNIRTGRSSKVQEKTLHQIAEAYEVSFAQLVGLEVIPGFDPPEPSLSTAHPELIPSASQNTLPRLPSIAHPVRRWAFIFIVMIPVIVIATLVLRSRLRPAASTSPECYRHYVEGIEYLKRLYRDEARACFLRAVNCDSTYAMAYAMLIHPDMWNSDDERNKFAALAVRYSDRTKGEEKMLIDALCAWYTKEYSEVIGVFEQLVAVHSSPLAYRLLGRLYLIQGDIPRAIASYKAAVAADEEDCMSYNRLAYLYAYLGQYRRALDAVDRYMVLAPDDANPYDTKADILSRLGECNEAIALYEKALARKPDFQPSIQSLGSIYLLRGDWQKAEEYYCRLLSMQDSGARSHARTLLASIPVFRGQPDSSLTQLRRAVAADELIGQLGSTYWNKLHACAVLLANFNKLDEAIEIYNELLSLIEKAPRPQIVEWVPNYIHLVARQDTMRARRELQHFKAKWPPTSERRKRNYEIAQGWIYYYEAMYQDACDSFIRGTDIFRKFWSR